MRCTGRRTIVYTVLLTLFAVTFYHIFFSGGSSPSPSHVRPNENKNTTSHLSSRALRCLRASPASSVICAQLSTTCIFTPSTSASVPSSAHCVFVLSPAGKNLSVELQIYCHVRPFRTNLRRYTRSASGTRRHGPARAKCTTGVVLEQIVAAASPECRIRSAFRSALVLTLHTSIYTRHYKAQ